MVTIENLRDCISRVNKQELSLTVTGQRENSPDLPFFLEGFKSSGFRKFMIFKSEIEGLSWESGEIKLSGSNMFETKGGRTACMWKLASLESCAIVFIFREKVEEKQFYTEREVALKKLPKFKVLLSEG